MPSDVVDVFGFGFGLHLAQSGKKHEHAKPLKGFGGASQDMDLIRERLKAAQAHAKGA